MTGYSNIKTKLKGSKRKFPYGGYVPDDNEDLVVKGAGVDADTSQFNGQLPTNARNRALLNSPQDDRTGLSGSSVASAGNFLGDTVNSFNNGGTGNGSVALSTASGALKGAGEGALIGSAVPIVGTAIGAVAGGLIGGVSSFFGAKKQQKELVTERQQQQDAFKDAANKQSGQVLRQYANNGVQDEQLYADGGLINTYMKNHPLRSARPFRKIDDDLPYFSTPVIQPQQTSDSPQTFADGGELGPPPKNAPLSDKFKLEWNGMVRQMGKDGVAGNPNLDYRATAVGSDYLKKYALSHGTTQLSPDSVERVQTEMNGIRNKIWNLKQQGVVKQPVDNANQFFPNQSKPDGWLGSKTSQEQFPSYFINGQNKGLIGQDLIPHGTIDQGAVDPGVNVTKPEALAKMKKGGLLPKYKYDDGGITNPDWEAEGNEVIQGQDAQPQQSTQLASDMQQINGPSHEQGGVPGTGGERIFSDRMRVSPVLQSVLRTNGIKIQPKATYADVSNKLGKLKGKFEAKTDGVGQQTANVMLPRIEQSLNDTFNDQEMSKQTQSYKKFAKGGTIQGMKVNLDGYSMPNMFDLGGDIPGMYKKTNNDDEQTDLPTTLVQQPTQTPIINSDSSPSVLSQVGSFVNDNQGQIGNLGNYFANLGSINKLNTTVNSQTVASPNYNYVDRSGTAYSRNNALLHTGVNALTNSGRSVNASNIGTLYAKTLEGNEYINANENQRHDAYNNQYNERADRVNAENTSILNKASDDRRDLYNQKVALKLGARNAFQQGVVGNMAQKQAADLEQKKLLTVLASNDQNGVMSRFLNNYPQYKKLLSQYNSTSN